MPCCRRESIGQWSFYDDDLQRRLAASNQSISAREMTLNFTFLRGNVYRSPQRNKGPLNPRLNGVHKCHGPHGIFCFCLLKAKYCYCYCYCCRLFIDCFLLDYLFIYLL